MVAGSAQIRECDALRSARGLHASLSDLATSSSCNCCQVRVRCACILPNPHSRPTTLARSFVRAPPLVFSLRRCQRHGILCQETPSPLGACCRKVGNDYHHDAAAPRLPTSLELL